MKLKLSFFLLLIMLFCGVNAMAATTVTLDTSSSGSVKSGAWRTGSQVGYNNVKVIETDGGTIEWSDKTTQGIARISYWMTVDEEGASDAEIVFRTEYMEKHIPLSFAEGASGWRELGFVVVTGGGLYITVQGGANGEIYASAVKIEYLDDAYRSLDNLTTTYTEHIIFGTHASMGYQNNVRVNMKSIPKFDSKNAFVSAEAMLRYMGAYVEENGSQITFSVDGKEFSGNIDADNFKVNGETVEGCLATVYEEKTAINIAAAAKALGKNVFISNKGLVIISDKEVTLDEKTDKKEITNILGVLRNEEL